MFISFIRLFARLCSIQIHTMTTILRFLPTALFTLSIATTFRPSPPRPNLAWERSRLRGGGFV